MNFNKNLFPKITSELNTPELSNLPGQPTSQAVSDFSPASGNKMLGELAAKLRGTGNAQTFTNLSNSVNLVKGNNLIVATDKNSGASLGAVAETPKNDIPPEALGPNGNTGGGKYKVTLSAFPALGDGNDEVVFDIMPAVSESQSISYDTVDLIQHPGSILKYKGTDGRGWDVNAELVSRTVEEADRNLRILNTIRGWAMPFYGNGTADSLVTSRYLGAPPQVLILSGYGAKMIGPVTCVMSNFSWTFENDMDYIRTSDGTPFPVLMKITINLKETWTPSQFTSFNLMEYRAGNLKYAFAGNAPGPSAAAGVSSVPVAGGESAIDLTSTPSIGPDFAANYSNNRSQRFSGGLTGDLVGKYGGYNLNSSSGSDSGASTGGSNAGIFEGLARARGGAGGG